MKCSKKYLRPHLFVNQLSMQDTKSEQNEREVGTVPYSSYLLRLLLVTTMAAVLRIRDVYPGSRIPDPDFYPSRVPDPKRER